MRNFVCFVLVLLLMGYWVHKDHLGAQLRWEPAPTRNELAPGEPVQVLVSSGEAAPWTFKGFTITPLARYQIKARLLHSESYVFDQNGDLSPLDFALGWGRMSDPAIYNELNIGQGARWYSYHYSDEPPIPDAEISSHSANTHLIPATDKVKDQLFDFQAGDVVQLDGYLVQVSSPSGFQWRSSLSRTDTGNGSCELMWVTDATKVGR